MDTPIIPHNLPSGKGPNGSTPDWQEVQPWDECKYFVARKALADLRLYPDGPMEGQYPDMEKEFRARLHHMVVELPFTEIVGLYRLARLLYLTPRPEQIFSYVQQITKADIARVYGSR